MPLDWANTQYNLGVAFWIIGERTGDIDDLRQAQAALRGALEVFEAVHYPREQRARYQLAAVEAEINRLEGR